MYKTRKNYGMVPATFSGMLDNMFPKHWDKVFFDDNWSNVTAPVNIKETESAFVIDVIAPGLKKEDFSINVEKDVLSISFEHKEEQKEEKDNIIRNEYQFRSFKRNFTLGEKVNAEAISATYTDGVLSVNLPKKEETKIEAKKITVA